MAMMAKRVGSLIVSAHDSDAPTDAEWDAMLSLIRGATGALVYTSGGGPNSAQRKRAAERGLTALRSAVLTTSTMARGVVTALSWLGATDTRAFGPEQVEEALAFLNVPAAERKEVTATLELLRKSVRAT